MTIDVYISGDNSVFDIDHNDVINEIPIVIHNDHYNPASKVFLNLPKTSSKLDIHSPISTDSDNLDLILLLNNDCLLYTSPSPRDA